MAQMNHLLCRICVAYTWGGFNHFAPEKRYWIAKNLLESQLETLRPYLYPYPVFIVQLVKLCSCQYQFVILFEPKKKLEQTLNAIQLA